MKLLRTAAVVLLAASLLGCPKSSTKAPGNPPQADPALGAGDPVPEQAPGGDTGTPKAASETLTPSSISSGDGFRGLFSGDGLALHLAQAGSTLRGTVEFRGDSYPVTARAESPEHLVGSFTSKGREFPLSATIEGEKVILKSSNKTYRLERGQPEDPLAGWVASGKTSKLPSFRGNYLGTVEGKPASLKLLDASADLAGELTCAGHRYTLEGSQGLRSATGSLQDVLRKGKRMTFELTLREVGVLSLTVTVAGDDGVQKHMVAMFQRVDD